MRMLYAASGGELNPKLIKFPLPEDSDGKPVNPPGNIGVVYEGLAKILDQPIDRKYPATNLDAGCYG